MSCLLCSVLLICSVCWHFLSFKIRIGGLTGKQCCAVCHTPRALFFSPSYTHTDFREHTPFPVAYAGSLIIPPLPGDPIRVVLTFTELQSSMLVTSVFCDHKHKRLFFLSFLNRNLTEKYQPSPMLTSHMGDLNNK